jgi:hypothetical protein
MKPDLNKIIQAVTTIQKELQCYEKAATVDDPYIQIYPSEVEVVDCDGCVLARGQALEEVLGYVDFLR